MQESTRIVANTLSAYARLSALALVGIVATPIALHILGPADYGIFSVIGGTLAFLVFINGALIAGAVRHISYSLGKKDRDDAAKWFAVSLTVHAFLAIAVCAIALIASHWVLFSLLHFPASRRDAAIFIYRLVVVAMTCNVIATPFQALMIAHESIVMLSLIYILSASTTLGGILLLKFLPGDHLIWYATIYCCSQLMLFIGPILYSVFRYYECRSLNLRALHMRDVGGLLNFSIWNFMGALGAVVRMQGPAILFNIFFGPVANAAYGLANQFSSFSLEVSWGVLRATTAPIVKHHAAGDHFRMSALTNMANKYAFFILWCVIAPVLFETAFCLHLWLRKVPPHTERFMDLLLIALLIDQLTMGFSAALMAKGRIALYQILQSSATCIAVLIGYLLLRAGMPADSVLWAGIGGAVLSGWCRLGLAIRIVGIPFSDWLHDVAAPLAVAVCCSSAAMISILKLMNGGAVRFCVVVLVNAVVACSVMWRLGVTKEHQARLITTLNHSWLRVRGILAPAGRA